MANGPDGGFDLRVGPEEGDNAGNSTGKEGENAQEICDFAYERSIARRCPARAPGSPWQGENGVGFVPAGDIERTVQVQGTGNQDRAVDANAFRRVERIENES